MRPRFFLLLTVLGSACGFGGKGGDAVPDAAADGAVAPCPELSLQLTLDGVPVTVGNNSVINRVTDALALDAAGSCGRTGAPALLWRIPAEFAGDAGDTGASAITIFSVRPVTSSEVTLVATDGVETASISLNVTSLGFQRLAYTPVGTDNIEGMAIGAGKLWLAVANAGIYSLALDDPHAAAATGGLFLLEANLSGAISQPRQIFADGNTLWVRHNDERQKLYRFDAAQLDPTATETDFAGDAAGRNLETLGYFPGGVRFSAVGDDLFEFDGAAFTEITAAAGDARAVAADDAETWSGRDELRRHSDGAVLDVVLDEDDNLRSILLDQSEVWAGGGNGVARVAGDVVTRYIGVDGILNFAVEPSGDVWAGSSGSLWRYHRARDEWLELDGTGAGLANQNIKSLVVDTSGSEPVVYVGTDSGLHALTLRFSPP